ncbi:hypothetical protein EZV62_026307 [Acer yangbiense]|uniref:C-JID domain-containing protein n=1 Tax=Acer yangbiense TaxID=1000413 RepID=A0A5C7GR02_9ROSI|nr:hypothetical protein EZV62_026307 [Acer yangbiense]
MWSVFWLGEASSCANGLWSLSIGVGLRLGTEAVQGIFLYMFDLRDVQLGSQVFMKMYNLRTLVIKIYGEVHLHNSGLDYLPNGLRYLHWESYPLEVLPSSFNPENLVELDLSYSKIKQLWEGRKRVPKLKWLKLYHCKNLIGIPDLSNIPSAEIINLACCASLIEIHSSRECPKNLHSLQLEGCENLSSFPSNIHLSEEPSSSTSVVLHSSRNGSKFSLSCCYSLTKFPQISGNVKRLDLRGSGVEEVPSTIHILSKLESLDMEGCTRLKRISKSICKLKSLDRLNLWGCWKLESFPDILERMKLKYLNLGETAIKELPPSIGNLNRLELCPGGSGSFYFNFMNCLKLNRKAVSNLLIFFQDSIQKMQGMGTEKIISLFNVSHEVTSQLPPYHGRLLKTPDEEVKGTICLPGSEIPEWFSYKNSGSSINIPVLRNDCARSGYIMGFEVCLVIGLKGYYGELILSGIDVHYDFHIETSDGHKEVFFHNSIQFSSGLIRLDSDHILLGYNLSRKCYEFFQEFDTRLADRGMSDYVGTACKFNIRSKDFSGLSKNLGTHCKVKYCGIQPIYVQVMNSVSINQDTGDTSGCNDIAEETCESHPKRICTKANQCLNTDGL